MIHFLQAIALCLVLVEGNNAATYGRTHSIVGRGFLSAFSHEAVADPTHGRVNYLSEAEALAQNLTFASGDTFIMRADSKRVLRPSGPGRNSVRIHSNEQFSTHVVVMNIRHMPEGCATWPAAWELGDNWPSKGEIDIIEGVNNISPNQATVHTSPGCTMPQRTAQTGTTVGTDCNAYVNNNAGCGVKSNKPNSFAGGFNAVGGGWYAMERTNSFIKVWFWSRNDGSVPEDVRKGASSINTGKWGTPFADFPDSHCDLAAKFGPNNIIINLTFCGDWAGSVFSSQGCGNNCNDFVNNNPGAFADAYWNFASLNIYQ